MSKPKSKTKPKTKNNLKQDFIKRLAYLLLCAIPIFLLANEKSDLRLVVLPLLFLGGMQVIFIGRFCIKVIEHYFPTKTYNSQQTIGEKIVYYGSFVYFIGVFYAIITLGRAKNVIGEWQFFWKYAFIGIGIAIVILLVLRWVVTTTYEDYYRRWTLIFTIPLITMLLTSAIAFQYNSEFTILKYYTSNYKVIEKHTSGRSGKSYSLKINTSFGEENLKVPKKVYDRAFIGCNLQLVCYPGGLGYDVVEDIYVK